MTINTELQAARSRVDQQQQSLEQARQALAIAEHQAYSDALQLIANEVRDLTSSPSADADDAIANIGVVLDGIGIAPSPKAQQPAAVAR